MNGTRHSRTYPWRRPLRWLWLALALAASGAVSYTHLRAHETRHDLVCRLLLEKKKKTI